jgi:hypothetical protein
MILAQADSFLIKNKIDHPADGLFCIMVILQLE